MSGDRAVHHCLSRRDGQLLFGKVKLMLNVPIAQGDHVYIESQRQLNILEVLGRVSQCSGHKVECIGVESSAGLPGHAS